MMPGMVELRPKYHTLPMKLKVQLTRASRFDQVLPPHRTNRLYLQDVLLLRLARLPSHSRLPGHEAWTGATPAFKGTKESSVKLSELRRDRPWTRRSESGQQRPRNTRATRKTLLLIRTMPNAVSPSQVPQAVLHRYLLRGAYRKILLGHYRRTIRPAPVWTLTRDLPPQWATPKFVLHHPSPELCLPVCLCQSPR